MSKLIINKANDSESFLNLILGCLVGGQVIQYFTPPIVHIPSFVKSSCSLRVPILIHGKLSHK